MNETTPPNNATLFRRLVGLISSLVVGLVLGWLAFLVQQQDVLPAFLFPLIFPICVGAAAGIACFELNRRLRVTTVGQICLTATLVGLAVVSGQTVSSYRSYVASRDQAIRQNPKAAAASLIVDEFRPLPLSGFVAAQVRRSRGWWIADAALIVATCVALCYARARSVQFKLPTSDQSFKGPLTS
jgi:hypothetical protein